MSLAASSANYPVLDIFWSILEFFLWVIWIWLLIWIFIDIFRSHDLSGWAKALWFLFVLIIPLVGVLVYLIVRGGSMHERSVRQGQHQDEGFPPHLAQTAAPASGRGLPPLRAAGGGQLAGQHGGPADEAGRPARPRRHLRRGVRPREAEAPRGLTARPASAGRLLWRLRSV